jgi:1-acyl-sn-glycerol-3-phosphate acyltransferase
MKQGVQSVARGLVLMYSLLEVLVYFAVLRLRYGKELSLSQRSAWLHAACKTIVRRLSMSVSISGSMPGCGLVVSNHLSYLDILFYASRMPCIFVSKSEVLSWPLFGLLARCGGTIFVERGRAAGVDGPTRKIADALVRGITVVLFPEGTSTDGGAVLPFRSALFQAAVDAGVPIYVSAIAYYLEAGVEADLCYYGDITFFPHLLQALGRKGVESRMRIHDEAQVYADRKIAARESWVHVVSLRDQVMMQQS